MRESNAIDTVDPELQLVLETSEEVLDGELDTCTALWELGYQGNTRIGRWPLGYAIIQEAHEFFIRQDVPFPFVI